MSMVDNTSMLVELLIVLNDWYGVLSSFIENDQNISFSSFVTSKIMIVVIVYSITVWCVLV